MADRYQRITNESDIDYLLRLVEIKMTEKPNDLDWQDVVDCLSLNVNYDTLRKAMQPKMFGAYDIYKHFKNKYENSKINNDDILKEYELKKQELQKEKIKIQTEKLSLTQALREEARFELFVEHAIEAINNVKPVEINEIKIPTTIYNENKSGLLLLADCHYGTEFVIKGLQGEILNEYSPEVFENRMWELLNKTIEIVIKEGLNIISIFNLGDELEGILRLSQLMTLKLGIVESSIQFSYFLATWLNELSKYVSIDYYSTEGNHTDLRLLTGKKGDFPTENMSKVIQVLVSEILKDNPNITIHSNNTDKIYTNIQGYNVLGIHGEEKSITKAIKDFSFIYNTQIDYLISGHKHHSNGANIGINKGYIGAGSIMGIDDYSMKLKLTSNPSSSFVVFEEGKCKSIEYTINLN